MKRQFDFVTNSSTSSFVGFGLAINLCDFSEEDRFKEMRDAIEKEGLCLHHEYEKDDHYRNVCESITEYISSQCNKDEELRYITYVHDYYSEILFVGVPIENHLKNENETVGEFKDKVKNCFKKLGFNESIYFINEPVIET